MHENRSVHNYSAWVLQSNLNITEILSILPAVILNKNASSRFGVNTTMFDIFSALGIENWNEKINYGLYYKNCNPLSCSYTITKNFNIPTVITTIVGLIGGLSVILRIITPIVIKLCRRQRRRTPIDITRAPLPGKSIIQIKKIFENTYLLSIELYFTC